VVPKQTLCFISSYLHVTQHQVALLPLPLRAYVRFYPRRIVTMQVALRYACEIDADVRMVREHLNYNGRVSNNVHEPLRCRCGGRESSVVERSSPIA
jgi:hypothetical protein